MDFLITLNDESKHLIHYGVKGMHWGVWNEETRQRRTGYQKVVDKYVADPTKKTNARRLLGRTVQKEAWSKDGMKAWLEDVKTIPKDLWEKGLLGAQKHHDELYSKRLTDLANKTIRESAEYQKIGKDRVDSLLVDITMQTYGSQYRYEMRRRGSS